MQEGYAMVQVTLNLNNPSKSFMQSLQELVSAAGHSMQIKKSKKAKIQRISSLDKSIKEFEDGQIIECKDFADYQAKMRE